MRFGLWIRGQYDAQDSLRQRFLEVVEQVRLARDVGFQMISAGQHYLNAPYQEIHWSPLLSRLAAESGDMRLATSIVILPLHNPVEMAEEVASLDVICDGRFVFGVGLGYRQAEFQAFGVRLKDRVPRFVEAVELMRRLWTEERVTFEGKFFQVRDAGIGVKPIQKPPPIWGGFTADRAVQRAGRMGLPWLSASSTTLTTLERQMGLYKEAAREAGQALPEDSPIFREIYVAETHEEALREAGRYLEPRYQAYHRAGLDRNLPPEERFDVPFDRLAEGRFILGDAGECIEQIREHEERLGVNWLIVRVQWPGMAHGPAMKIIERLGKDVLPAFK